MATQALNCPCGLMLTGTDDEDLLRKGRAPSTSTIRRRDHRRVIRDHVRANARDIDEAVGA
jgi:hypothetical protein